MSKTKAIFFGTQEFAATILQALIAGDIVSVDLVFTQPDRKTGRKQIVEESPVKKLALVHGIAIQQLESLKSYKLQATSYALGIVAQYGLIIPKNIIEFFPKGMINVHGSLLPKYRGASPIQMALINGEKTTGVTIMLMDEKMDHGPILSQEKMDIAEDDTFTTLSQKMATVGAELLLATIPKYLNGEITPQIQPHEQATFTKLLAKDDGKINFNKTAEEIYNLYRGLTPWPGVWTTWNGKRLKLLKIVPAEKNLSTGQVVVEAPQHQVAKGNRCGARIFVGCGKESIEILELQLEGKSAMDAKTFFNGYKNFVGVKL